MEINIDNFKNIVLEKYAKEIIKSGEFDNDIILELNNDMNNYEQLELKAVWYEDGVFEDLTWIDIEGFGYGWLWNTDEYRDKEELWHEMIKSACLREIEIFKPSDRVYYFVYKNEMDELYYHFIRINKMHKCIVGYPDECEMDCDNCKDKNLVDNRSDVVIRMSNNEMDIW